MHLEIFLRWYMVGFFVLFGIAMIVWRRRFATIGCLISTARLDERDAARVKDAVARRVRLEGLNGAAMASVIGSASLVAGALAVFTALDPTLLYAVVCVVLSATLANGYLHLRRAGTRRIASLRARDRGSVVPVWLSVVVALTAVTPLAFIDIAPVAAILATVAAVVIAVVGERVAHLPALLSGDDPAVDAFVDERLRAVRVVNIVGTATAPAYVFDACTWTTSTVTHGFGGLHAVAVSIAFVGLMAACGWLLVVVRRPADAHETERWSHLGA
jgi:hypothetical protein